MITAIRDIRGYEVLDSRGTPTVEAAVHLEGGHIGHFSVPSGASTGQHEALELRDGDESRYCGLGVSRAVANVSGPIRSELIGKDAADQRGIDSMLRDLDGTENKSRLGANAILAVSVACARAVARARGRRDDEYFAALGGNGEAFRLPVPMFNVLNGGCHADSGLDIQEYMIAPYGAPNVREAVRWGVEVYRALRKLLLQEGHRISVGDEGGFAPRLKTNEAAVQLIVAAIQEVGYQPGKQIGIVLDVAASELYKEGRYTLQATEGMASASATDLIALFERWIENYPIVAIEDGLAENDWAGWHDLTGSLGDKLQLIGDDIFVTNTRKLSLAIERKVGNAVIIKPNQIGTLTETIDTVRYAQEHHYTPVMANRSAETTETCIATLAIGLAIPQIKTGAPCRGERTAKYNELMRIESDLGDSASYWGSHSFARVNHWDRPGASVQSPVCARGR